MWQILAILGARLRAGNLSESRVFFFSVFIRFYKEGYMALVLCKNTLRTHDSSAPASAIPLLAPDLAFVSAPCPQARFAFWFIE